ncbi:predicted protein [Botrytis cinerea T4]|uniref:Uncharacterized protein n=1 Tax=Botryotinia fuckeliana (strain T4) TaxID=999810 RepID=G2Y1W1_BOTF4|nr:predicted protein [Botrytis cinerea T4]
MLSSKMPCSVASRSPFIEPLICSTSEYFLIPTMGGTVTVPSGSSTSLLSTQSRYNSQHPLPHFCEA